MHQLFTSTQKKTLQVVDYILIILYFRHNTIYKINYTKKYYC